LRKPFHIKDAVAQAQAAFQGRGGNEWSGRRFVILSGDTPLLTFSAAPYDEIRLLLKRLTDIVIACAGLIVLSPFMLATALLVGLAFGRPQSLLLLAVAFSASDPVFELAGVADSHSVLSPP